MNITRYRNTLIAAAVAVSLGAGVAACSKPPESSANDSRSNTADEPLSDNSRGGTLSGTGTSSGGTSSGGTSSGGAYGSSTSGSGGLAGSGSGPSSGSSTSSGSDTSAGTTYGSGTSSRSTASLPATGESAQDAVSDTGITTKVKGLLLADSDAKGFDVDVETRNGVVMLQGALKDQDAIDHVKQIAAGVEGVKSVNVTELTVDDQR